MPASTRCPRYARLIAAAKKLKAIVLSWDRHQVMTQHMILQYARLWPDHPFLFYIPFQRLRGVDSAREMYIETPPDIPGTVLGLIKDLPDEEWVYWCADDKYPIQLVTKKLDSLLVDAEASAGMSGLLFCRCRVTLDRPDLSLLPGERRARSGETLLERQRWYQIWIHQFLRVKVLRYFFTHMPSDIPNAKVMDELKNDIPKPDDMRLFVTKENYAVFGESTRLGQITRNCYKSIRETELELPEWFQRPTSDDVTMGKLPTASRWNKLKKVIARK